LALHFTILEFDIKRDYNNMDKIKMSAIIKARKIYNTDPRFNPIMGTGAP